MAKQYSHSERQQHLDAWQQSGLSKQHYCQQQTINVASFYYWLKHRQDDAVIPVPSAFIPAHRIIPETHETNTVILNLPVSIPDQSHTHHGASTTF